MQPFTNISPMSKECQMSDTSLDAETCILPWRDPVEASILYVLYFLNLHAIGKVVGISGAAFAVLILSGAVLFR